MATVSGRGPDRKSAAHAVVTLSEIGAPNHTLQVRLCAG